MKMTEFIAPVSKVAIIVASGVYGSSKNFHRVNDKMKAQFVGAVLMPTKDHKKKDADCDAYMKPSPEQLKGKAELPDGYYLALAFKVGNVVKCIIASGLEDCEKGKEYMFVDIGEKDSTGKYTIWYVKGSKAHLEAIGQADNVLATEEATEEDGV